MDSKNLLTIFFFCGLLGSFAFIYTSCSETADIPYIQVERDSGEEEEDDLIFQSGFEGTTRIVARQNSSDDEITGSDPDLRLSSWDDLKVFGGINSVYFNYTGGDITQRRADIIDDPTSDTGNKILRFWMDEAWLASEGETKARVQLEFHNIRGGYKEFYQSVRVFFPEESFNTVKNYPRGINWLTISEFWNNEWWDASELYGFRVTLGIGKEEGAGKDLYFSLNAEDMGFIEVWNADNKDYHIPIGQWFTMNYYYKEGNKETGQFYMTVTPDGEEPVVVFDVHDFTHMTQDPTPDGVTAYNPLKLYTSEELMDYMKAQGQPLEIYWDDLKLWKTRPSE